MVSRSVSSRFFFMVQANVLPTNSMRACTAAIVELSHNADGSGHLYQGEIEFITAAEWAAELDALLDDLTRQDGLAVLHVSDPNASNYSSWCKLFAVYGEQRRERKTEREKIYFSL